MSSWLLYVLELSDGTLYTGITNDLDKRMKDHRNGKGSKYVKSRLPFTCIYTENCLDRSDASKKEAAFKKLSRKEKLCKIK